jgi:hypothetical protein
MTTLYKLIAIATVGLYAGAGLFGWEFGAEEKGRLPPSVRQSPGGYRSVHFWHMGIHGGK